MKRFRDRFPHMRKPVPKFNRTMHRERTPPRMTAKITAPPGTSGGGEERDASEAGSEKSRPTNYGAADWSLFPRFEVRKRFATSSGQDRKAVPCLNGRTGRTRKRRRSKEALKIACELSANTPPFVRTTEPLPHAGKTVFPAGFAALFPPPKRAPPTVRATVRVPLKTPFGSPPAFPSAKLVFRIELSCRRSPHRSREAIRLSFRGRFRAHSHRDTGRNAPGSGRFERIRKEGGDRGDRGAAFIHRYNTRTYDDSPLVSSVRRHRRKCVYGMRKHSFVLARSIRTVADETTTARTVFNYRSSGCFSFDYAMGPWRVRAFYRRISVVHFRCGAFFRLQTPGRGGGYSTVTDLARLRG